MRRWIALLALLTTVWPSVVAAECLTGILSAAASREHGCMHCDAQPTTGPDTGQATPDRGRSTHDPAGHGDTGCHRAASCTLVMVEATPEDRGDEPSGRTPSGRLTSISPRSATPQPADPPPPRRPA